MPKWLIFVAGMVCGTSLLFLGVWTWSTLSSWLPYQSPNPDTVKKLETLVVLNTKTWDGRPLPIEKYRRWYVQGSENGHQIIWSEWEIPDPARYSPGIVLGHRRYPPDEVYLLGGGCGQVHIAYDLSDSRLISDRCNAPE